MRAYLDTSVLVALLTDDPSTNRADAFVRHHAAIAVVSDFGAAEFASALARRVRMGEIDAGQAQAAFSDLDQWIARVAQRIELGPSDVADAAMVLRRLDLRCARRMPSISLSAAVLRPRSPPSTTRWRRPHGRSASMSCRLRGMTAGGRTSRQ